MFRWVPPICTAVSSFLETNKDKLTREAEQLREREKERERERKRERESADDNVHPDPQHWIYAPISMFLLCRISNLHLAGSAFRSLPVKYRFLLNELRYLNKTVHGVFFYTLLCPNTLSGESTKRVIKETKICYLLQTLNS